MALTISTTILDNAEPDEIRVRIQLLDTSHPNNRPDEDDLLEGQQWVATSIGDLPSVGDYIALQDLNTKQTHCYKVLTRLFDFQMRSKDKTRGFVFCNIIVSNTPPIEVGQLVKD